MVSDTLLVRFSEFVATRLGLHFPKERWRDLERGIRSAAQELHHPDVESCIHWLLSSSLTQRQVEILSSHLTVGETYFFREKRTFEALEGQILPAIIRSRREAEQRYLRCWSAGCCTGEEPYSLAILLDKLLPDIAEWQITLLATDLNPRFLQKAVDGVYGQWSFRDTPSWVRERYFEKGRGNRFEILLCIRKMVSFSYLNLMEDTYPSLLNNTNGMDLILCRNVLMYFAPEGVRHVIRRLYRALMEGGWLVVSPTETSHVLFAPFITVNFPGAILYRKDGTLRDENGVEEWKSERTQEWKSGRVEEQQSGRVEEWKSGRKKEEKNRRLFHSSIPPFGRSGEERSVLPFGESGEEGSIPHVLRVTPYEEALALYERGRYEEVVEKLAGMLSRNHDDPKAMALLARVYANQGNLPEAVTWCERAIVADKLNSTYHYLMATILQELGRVDEATMSLRRALYLDQDFILAHVALGNLTMRQGKSKEARRHFENALSLLQRCRSDEMLPEADGMTAGRLMEILRQHI